MTEFRHWLSKTGYTIETFAKEVGLHYATVAKWSSGVSKPRDVSKIVLRTRFPNCPLVSEEKHQVR